MTVRPAALALSPKRPQDLAPISPPRRLALANSHAQSLRADVLRAVPWPLLQGLVFGSLGLYDVYLRVEAERDLKARESNYD